jgi:acylphosphatase
MMVRCRVIVHGRVQGVGFRVFVARAARARGVSGWVRNRPDGTVEAVLEGESGPLESVVRCCGEGPRAAFVEHLERLAEEPERLSGFEVR